MDDEDYEDLSRFRWQVAGDMTVQSHAVGLMSRYLLNAPPELEVDHIDGNRLNNQRSNLRLATSSQNKCNRGPRKDNTSGYKGVSWHSQKKKWTARIKAPSGKYLHLGLFDEVKDAALAYNYAATEHHGSFAFLNKI